MTGLNTPSGDYPPKREYNLNYQHTHVNCQHTINYCSTCDMVYCTKCAKEWGVRAQWYPWTWQAGAGATDNTIYKVEHTHN